MTNEVQAEVERQLKRQIKKGEDKYGHGIRVDDSYDWLQEAIEECVDMLQYLCAAKVERDKRKQYIEVSNYVDVDGTLVYNEFEMDDTRVPTNKMKHGLD